MYVQFPEGLRIKLTEECRVVVKPSWNIPMGEDTTGLTVNK